MIILAFIIGTLLGMWIDRSFIVWVFNKFVAYTEKLQVELKEAEARVYNYTSTTSKTVTENANKSYH